MVFLEDLTCQEAADILDIPLGTVLSRIARARAKLRAALESLDPNWLTSMQDKGLKIPGNGFHQVKEGHR